MLPITKIWKHNMKTTADNSSEQRLHRRLQLLKRNQVLILGAYLGARGDGLDDAAVMLCDLDDEWAREFTRWWVNLACPSQLTQFDSHCRSCPEGLSPVVIYPLPREVAAYSMDWGDTSEKSNICSPAAPGLFNAVVLAESGVLHALLSASARGASGDD
jgi:hypothetical protein